MINWKVRIKNKNFWITIIPAILILVKIVTEVFGIDLDTGEIGGKCVEVVEAVFGILVIMGVVNDPTTEGLADSARAMTYDKPKGDD